jgi:hypothetical protein
MSMQALFRRLESADLQRLLAHPEEVSAFIYAEPDDKFLDIDKSWQTIHFLLTDDLWDTSTLLGKAILGGRDIGEDQGYGPARILDTPEVAKIAEALEMISAEEMQRRFDVRKLQKAAVYCPPHDDGDATYYLNYFSKLKAYYAEAACKGNGMLLMMS